MLAEDAIKAAVKDYEAKRAKQNGSSAEAASSEKVADAWSGRTYLVADVADWN